ncbi:uncharacterized protein J8A68_001639 [[Candida] subhashii]|uniref:Calcineurin-like phosphoesterase domain-containing protein n=1 Tax=[Candida] subhashii TaxID=561895 RepID=A0A8J5QTG2_9ASCO|nr:uncharacterized protein J8A68_001639 [[Candida] subhashii]KAG7664822.1 hypothetical protein J8A68_001639 [[Candida] subhashii]
MLSIKLLLPVFIIVGFIHLIRLHNNVISSLKPSKFDSSQIRNLTWNDINFLHTTDTHGWYSGHLNQKQYNGDWGNFISFVTHMRRKAHQQGQDFLLVDSGDRHDGNGLSDITKPNGIISTPIFIKQDYDIVTIGNHELYVWENSKQEFELVAGHFPDNYISSNVEFGLENGTFVPFGKKYRYFRTPIQGIRTLAFGFLFNFDRFNNGTRVTPIARAIKQAWFKEVLETYKDKVDLIVIAGHTPITREWPEFHILHSALREYYPNTVIQYFGGHSHIRDFVVIDKLSTGLQSGRYCETVGWTSINIQDKQGLEVRDRFSRSYIDFNLHSFLHHTDKTEDEFHTKNGVSLSQYIVDTRDELQLNSAIGHVRHSNYYVDYVPLDHPSNIFNLLTSKILHTLEPDKDVQSEEERIVIINTGSIRYDLYKGPYTIDSQYIVSPFENLWVKLTVPKSIGSRVAKILNDDGYIVQGEGPEKPSQIDNRRLLPPHHYFNSMKLQQKRDQIPFDMEVDERLSKGYVTHDDFGQDGDDTVHRAVVNYPIPNVVESVQVLKTEEDTDIDLVFYNFITPNILWALNELKYTTNVTVPVTYSSKYLGIILNEYIQNFEI